MLTYGGMIDEWFQSVKNYRQNYSVRPKHVPEKKISYAVYEWKYASRVVMLDVNKTVRVFYLLDFPNWLEPFCYLCGWLAYISAIVAVYKVANANPGLQSGMFLLAFVCANVAAMLCIIPDIFPKIISEAMKYSADRLYWKHFSGRMLKFDFRNPDDRRRCRYFGFTLVSCHSGNTQLMAALDESNAVMEDLDLGLRVGDSSSGTRLD